MFYNIDDLADIAREALTIRNKKLAHRFAQRNK